MPPPVWTGPTSPSLGTTQTYTFNNGNIYTNVTWFSSKGRVVSQSQSGTTYTVLIEWIASGGTSIQFAYDDDILPAGGTYSVSVTNVAPPVPTATSFSSTQQCNSTTVHRAGLPTSYAWVWYWQTASTGTSTTLGSSSSATITTPGTLYLRARTASSPYLWSSTSQTAGTFTVVTPPATPTTANDQHVIRNGIGDVTLTTSTVTNATAYRWYDQNTGGVLLYEGPIPSFTTSLSQTKTFYVESVIGTCASTTRKAVTAFIYPEPVITASAPTISMDADATLSVTNFAYDEYHWVDATTNLDVVGATSSTFNTDRTGSYKVRVKKGPVEKLSPVQEILSVAESQPGNYVVSNTIKIAGVTDPGKVASLPVEANNQTIQYFDGLARPIQTVITQGSPTKKDIVQPVVYDVYGREDKQYLPVTVNASQGLYQDNILNAAGNYAGLAANFYSNTSKVATDAKPYGNTVFEASPFNRPEKTYGPGVKWSDVPGNDNKYIGTAYRLNEHTTGTSATAEAVIAWTVNASGQPVRSTYGGQHLASGGYYNAGQLAITVSTDEQGNVVREYTNRKGQLILRKIWMDKTITSNLNHATAWALTYYIFDDLGNLRYVLQPELSKLCHGGTTITTTLLDELSFQYKYDYRNRMSEKRVPGAGWIYMVYDNRDRLVLTQDGNQRTATPTKEWTFIKYDAFNRPVLTGRYYNNADQATMQVNVNTFYNTVSPGQVLSEMYIKGVTGNVLGYSNQSFPLVSAESEYYSVTYYDGYDTFMAPTGYTYSYTALMDPETGLSQETAAVVNGARVIGQITGTRVKILGATTWMRTVNYYDQDYKLVQSISDNQKGGKIVASNIVDFTGKIVYTKRTYTYDVSTTSIVENPSFDHADRLLHVKHATVGSTTTEVILVKNEYNELGQVVDKKLHSSDNGTTYRQSVDYRYNIRGWLTSINNAKLTVASGTNDDNNDLFGMELGYNTDIGLGVGTGVQYNGNISAIRWSNNSINSNVLERAYTFAYDGGNRLKTASQKEAIIFDAWVNGRFNENVPEYDLNGNIKKLQRTDGTGSLIDDLTYTYTSSNKLQAVSDAGSATLGFVNGNTALDDYQYDSNGNLKLDKNEGITAITYNHLNLPVQVNKGATDYIIYTYDASGRKLTQQVFGSTPKITHYVGELVLEGSTLKLIQHAEGRILPDAGNTWEYQYHLKDHLGNVRTTFSTKQLTETKIATLETANVAAEQAAFLRLAEAKKVNFYMFDRTNGSAPSTTNGYAQRLNGSANEKFGLARSISVMPGDVITTEVYAKYLEPVQSNWQSGSALITLFAQLAAGTAPNGTIVDGVNYGGSTSSFPFPVQAAQNTSTSNETGPKAYLNWLVFKRDGTFLPAKSGFDRLSSNAREYGQDGAHERLYSPTIQIEEQGFVYIYVSNEETTSLEVYFDDFKVTQTTNNPVIQSDNYYPFGLSFNSYARENSVANDYKYNGKEEQNELNLGWLDYGARMYMADIGRWGVVDPLSEKMRRHSAYNYAFDNPVMFVDPDGMEPMAWADETSPSGFAFGGSNDPRTQRSYGGLIPGKNSKEEENRIAKMQQLLGNIATAGAKIAQQLTQEQQTKGGISITVTDNIVGTAWVKGYPDAVSDGNGKYIFYEVPTYEMVVSGLDKNGAVSSKTFSVIRFGVQHTGTSKPFMTGLTNAGTYVGTWGVMRSGGEGLHLDGASNGGVYIHAGPPDNTWLVGAIKCIELCGPGSWTGFKSYINSLGGRAMPTTISIEAAAMPPLVQKGTYKP